MRIGTIAYLTISCNGGKIKPMSANINTTLKLYESTRKNLRLLAALQDRTMMEIAEELVAKALEEAEQERSEHQRLYGYREQEEVKLWETE